MMDVSTAARPACPFPGLRPFWREEAELFFGRDQEIAELRGALLGERRFVAVIGTSGCGKSSLVEAGLLPRLLAEGASGGRPWRNVSLRPLGAPVAKLAEADQTLFGQRPHAGVIALHQHGPRQTEHRVGKAAVVLCVATYGDALFQPRARGRIVAQDEGQQPQSGL